MTGLSGAGRSSALKKFLKIVGFEAIDNLPTYLLSNIINTKIKETFAVGIDVRTRDFDPKAVVKEISQKKEFNAFSHFF